MTGHLPAPSALSASYTGGSKITECILILVNVLHILAVNSEHVSSWFVEVKITNC